jgi:hypothetical protein
MKGGVLIAFDLRGWTPVNVAWRQERGSRVDWCWLGGQRFTEPFFEQTVAKALRDSEHRPFRRSTPLTALEGFENDAASLPPCGFIFHLSRCGSTLVAQLLAALPQNLVLSEAPPIEQLLDAHRGDPSFTHEQRIAQLRGLINALGQQRHCDERHLFIKFDSWQVLDLPLLIEAFPGVPWIFLYRDPVEIMVSQRRQRGTQMIPTIVDPRLLGFEPAVIANLSPDEYCARVLARIIGAAASHDRLGNGRLINFNQLPAVLWESLGGFFGVEWSERDVALMRQVSMADAKSPGLSYNDDCVGKQREASPELRRLVEAWLREPYEVLESLRLAHTDAAVTANALVASASSNSRSQSFTTQSITR